MHDKLIIIDGNILFTGSWNISYNDTYRNNNNLLEITDPRIIMNYQEKFNELYVDQNFGALARLKTPNPSITIDGIQVENYFSPVDEIEAKLVQYVSSAQQSVRFMVFTYTDEDLADAMIQRAKAGLDVQGVIEDYSASQGAMVPLFCAFNQNLVVKTDGNPYTMHHKVIIIDDKTVITGSYNFTRSADEENDENILVIQSPAVAALYLREFYTVYGIANDPGWVNCDSQ